jgi:hypothetical protein
MSDTTKPLGITSDYSRIAARYDETRSLPIDVLRAC